jgi:hypothetical protein
MAHQTPETVNRETANRASSPRTGDLKSSARAKRPTSSNLVARLSVIHRMLKDTIEEVDAVVAMDLFDQSLCENLRRSAKQLAAFADDVEGVRRRAAPSRGKSGHKPPRR